MTSFLNIIDHLLDAFSLALGPVLSYQIYGISVLSLVVFGFLTSLLCFVLWRES